MSSIINAEDLGKEIAIALKEYTSDVTEAIGEEIKEIATDAVKELKAASPKKSGDYAKGWSKRKEQDGYVIYNSKKPGLTHLLEHGHAKSGGGRVEGKVHIRPVEEKVNKRVEEAVEKAIKNGGK